MFCPNCGKGEQTRDTYCRNCGELLTDFSGKSYLVNKIVGGSSPEQQVNFNLIINLVTAIISSLLLISLSGYYDAHFVRTHEPTPPVIYLVYLFLGLVSAWQFLGFMIGLNLKSKLSGRRGSNITASSSEKEKTIPSGKPQELLPQADFENIAPMSVTEDATKILDKVPRK